MNCPACSYELNQGARFCSHCGRAVMEQRAWGQPFYPVRTLVRPRHGRCLGGVCAGFSQHFGWDVVLVRILLVVIVFFGCGTPILAYLIAWIVMPNEPYFFPMQPYTPYAPPPAQPVAATETPDGTQPAA
jgi:phage shock protein C